MTSSFQIGRNNLINHIIRFNDPFIIVRKKDILSFEAEFSGYHQFFGSMPKFLKKPKPTPSFLFLKFFS